MFEVTKEFSFESAHCLSFHKKLCKNLHGHSYKLFVTVGRQELNNEDMVMDFSLLKQIVNEVVVEKYDHACMININSGDLFEIELKDILIKHNKKIVELPFYPTAENMAKEFYNKIKERLSNGLILKEIKVYETSTSYAVYR